MAAESLSSFSFAAAAAVLKSSSTSASLSSTSKTNGFAAAAFAPQGGALSRTSADGLGEGISAGPQRPSFDGLVEAHRKHMDLVSELLKSESRSLAQFNLRVSKLAEGSTVDAYREPLEKYLGELDDQLARKEQAVRTLRLLVQQARRLS